MTRLKGLVAQLNPERKIMPTQRVPQPSTKYFVLATLLLASCLPLTAEESDLAYPSPPDLMQWLENSETQYSIHPLENLADASGEALGAEMWPTMSSGVSNPQVSTSENGSRSLSSFVVSDGCAELLEQGEEFYGKKKYAKAAGFYQKAVEQFPKCYPAYSHLGDTHYFQGEFEKALSWYEKVVAMSPHDFIGYFYKGNALLRMERMEEARKSYVRALALHPRRDSVMGVAEAKAQELGIEVYREPFLPRALVRDNEGGVSIYVDPASPAWTFYGICKAVWFGEEEFRQQQTGEKERSWTTTEERQCLLVMLETYQRERGEGAVEDPVMERLLAILEDELLDAFLLYEIGARLSPNIMLLLPEEAFEKVLEYVGSYILKESKKVPKVDLSRGDVAP